MNRPHVSSRSLLGVAALAATVVLAACNGEGAANVTPQATATTPAATGAPATTGTPSPGPTETAAPTATETATPAAPSTATASPAAGDGAPAGYAESCAAGHPWGEQVTNVFVCLEAPGAGTALSAGDTLEVSGYAGGSFENNVVVELRDADNEVIEQQPVTYSAPDLGMPGPWEVEMTVPADAPVGPMRVTASFSSPRDGGLQALTSAELRVE